MTATFTSVLCINSSAAARSKEWVYERSPTGDRGFESNRGHGCLSVVSVVSCRVEVSATD
jgi:hypothetical protein